MAMWPDFFTARSREKGALTLHLEDGPILHTGVTWIKKGPSSVRGLQDEPELQEWLSSLAMKPGDDLIVRALDVEKRIYDLSLDRHRNPEAVQARTSELADAAEVVLRAGRRYMPDFELVPRLIAHDAYRHLAPPAPLEQTLRADLRFMLTSSMVELALKIVAECEKYMDVPPDALFSSRPPGRPPWRGRGAKGYDQDTGRAWAGYLFDRGMDHRWAGWNVEAEAYYRLALQLDEGHADGWVHLGISFWDAGRLDEALACDERGISAALERTIGDPERYPAPFWLDVDSRPFLRALAGKGLCLWRMGRNDQARAVWADLLRWNPNDNQGIRFIVADMDEGLTWEESVARSKAETGSVGQN